MLFSCRILFVPIHLNAHIIYYCSTTTAEEEHKYSKKECQNMATHLIHPSGLPDACKKYTDVVQYLKRHDTDTAHPTQYL